MSLLHEAIEYFRAIDEATTKPGGVYSAAQRVRQHQTGMRHSIHPAGPRQMHVTGKTTTRVGGGQTKPRTATAAKRLQHQRLVHKMTK